MKEDIICNDNCIKDTIVFLFALWHNYCSAYIINKLIDRIMKSDANREYFYIKSVVSL